MDSLILKKDWKKIIKNVSNYQLFDHGYLMEKSKTTWFRAQAPR